MDSCILGRIRMAADKLRGSDMMVAPSRAEMKNAGRRPEFFIRREAWG
ncbi:hypothetical protein [uncultured Duncaniella sp.]|nr:hypothetical protein [uncultured Duncaniella sp.]